MTRSLGHATLALLTAVCILGAEELPKNDDDPDSFDIEPPLLIPNRDTQKPGEVSAEPAATPDVDLAKIEKDLGRAERATANTARLYKIGAMAEVEVERLSLRVARLRAQLETGRLAEAKENFAEAQIRLTNKEISREEFAAAEANVARAIESAHAAESAHRRAEVEFAENDLARQRKLFSLGSGRKSDIARAEQKLNELKATPPEQN